MTRYQSPSHPKVLFQIRPVRGSEASVAFEKSQKLDWVKRLANGQSFDAEEARKILANAGFNQQEIEVELSKYTGSAEAGSSAGLPVIQEGVSTGSEQKKMKRKSLWVWFILAVLLSCLIPPWQETWTQSGAAVSKRPSGYHFVFFPPSSNDWPVVGYSLDAGRLLLQLGVLGGAFAILSIWRKRKQEE